MLLYFLDDRSLILYDEDKCCQSITLFQSDDFDIKRVVGQNYLSGLSGQEAYDFLYNQICENGISSSKKSDDAGNKETK